jgi:predicted dehydrogenase
MSTLRVGVIGLGMGRHHIKGYLTHPDAEVVAISDVNEHVRNEIGDLYGIQNRYQAGEEMIDNEHLDIVSVVTPNKYHHDLTICALEHGSHVLCEKPMAMDSTQAEEMVSFAKNRGLRLMINFSYRFTEQSMALKKQVESGIIGDIYFARTVWHRRRGLPKLGGWFGQKALSGGGPLIDLGVHRLDLALWLMGYPKPRWVLGSTYNHLATQITREKNLTFDVEDLAAGFIKFDNGASMVVEASWAAHIAEREFMETRLYGTTGGLLQHNVNETYEFEAEIFLVKGDAHFDMKLHTPLQPVQTPMYHFVDCIIKDQPHIATGEEGLLVMHILDALYASAHTGEPVRICNNH